MTSPTFFESLAMTDAAAERFCDSYPSRQATRELGSYIRLFCVPALRWLWRNGDVSNRATIAARVAVWRGMPPDYVEDLENRIYERETKR